MTASLFSTVPHRTNPFLNTESKEYFIWERLKLLRITERVTCTEQQLRELIEEVVVALDNEDLFDLPEQEAKEIKDQAFEEGRQSVMEDYSGIQDQAKVALGLVKDVELKPMSVFNLAAGLHDAVEALEKLIAVIVDET